METVAKHLFRIAFEAQDAEALCPEADVYATEVESFRAKEDLWFYEITLLSNGRVTIEIDSDEHPELATDQRSVLSLDDAAARLNSPEWVLVE